MSKLIEQLKRQEGLRLKPYKCTSDKLTIGYGRNLESNGISQHEANHMLENDILKVIAELQNRLEWFSVIDKVRSDVLANMAFNMGVAGLLKFKNMLAAIELGDYATAGYEMLDSKWAKQVGGRAEELSRQMVRGEYE
jgi:lysozyme